MRRHSRAGGKSPNAQAPKAVARKRRIARKSGHRRSTSIANLETEVARLTRERDEAFKQQTATADVLKVISRSTFDLPKVLNTLVESAARLCEANKGAIFRPTGKDASFYVAASYGHTAEYDEYQKNMTFAPGRGGVIGRVLLEGKSVQIPDVLADPEYTFRDIASVGDFRRIVGVPLLREGIPIGILVLQRAVVQPFNDKQIELVETFAVQAVIAIENTRLLNELRESLAQQTATSEILRVISSSQGDLKRVFENLLENATRLCGAKFGNLFLRTEDGFRYMAMHGVPSEYAELGKRLPKLALAQHPNIPLARMAREKKVLHIHDLALDESYTEHDPRIVALVETAGARTIVQVPMLKDDELVGAIVIYRQDVRPFTDKQIELVQNFAAQAVIAIENTRLLNELRQRTDDLTESLGQRTATSEVLGVISSSPGELAPVFDTILANALRLCDADMGHVYRAQAGALQVAAMRGGPPEFAESLRERGPWRPAPHGAPVEAMHKKKSVQITDLSQTAGYAARESNTVIAVELGGVRTVLWVPMVMDEKAIGLIVIYRSVVSPSRISRLPLSRASRNRR
jgi:two-component system, NtrC family, sensor kinase